MTERNLVSIIMPVRNSSDFLPACLNSILEQTEQDWELLAIDDNSSDNSAGILQSFSERESRIKVFCNQESGIIPALQSAYSHSRGNFITRMDSDDLMPPTKLETLKNKLLEAGLGHIATGLVEYFSGDVLGEGYRKYAEWLNQLSKEGRNFSEIYKECVIPSPCWMLYRSDFERCGAFNSPLYPEDYDLCFRFYGQKLKVLPAASTVLHLWRDYAARTSRTDPRYANNNFLNIKISYFLKLDYIPGKTLLLWGAGKKGKDIAKLLIEQNIDFTWITNNRNKVGLKIYGKSLTDQSSFVTDKRQQCIIAIANEVEQQEVRFIAGEMAVYCFC